MVSAMASLILAELCILLSLTNQQGSCRDGGP